MMLQQAIPFEEPRRRLITRGVKPVRVPYESESEWLELRGHGIGGSDIGAVVGFNPYRTALDVWLEKTGQVLPPDLSKNPAVRRGKKLEPIIIEYFEEDHGKRVQRVHAILARPDHPWMRVSLDGRVVGEPTIIEAKSVGFWAHKHGEWGESGTDKVPLSYLAQCLWGIAIDDKEKAVLPALVADQDPHYYVIERDDDLIEMLAGRGLEFWDRVERSLQILEQIDKSTSKAEIVELRDALMRLAPAAQTYEDVGKKYPSAIVGSSKQIEPRLRPLVAEFASIKDAQSKLNKELSDLKKREKELKRDIGEFMGECEILRDGIRDLITHKTIDRAGYTVEATSYREMRIASAEKKENKKAA